MITFESTGSFQNTEAFLNRMKKGDIFGTLDKYAQLGVKALASATPVDTGLTAGAWSYQVRKMGETYVIEWHNTNVATGFPVAIMLQFGHGTGTGGYVQGRDYINPAIRPVFDQIANEVWRVVTAA